MNKSTKFELIVRELTQYDADRIKIFVPERDDYEMYLSALVDDLRSAASIAASQLNDNSIIIETRAPLEERALMEIIKPYFSNERFDQYRFVSLIPI
jgi:phenolic acid decarboxylase